MSLVADAVLITGLSMAGLATIAYMEPSEAMITWKGPLLFANQMLLCAAGLSIVYPGSWAIYNVWIYGGCFLAGCMAMSHT